MSNIKYILLLIFITIGYSEVSAQGITGNYSIIDRDLIAADMGTSYVFLKNGTFQNIAFEHLGKKSISGGDYHIAGDTLVLQYKPQGTNLQSEFKVIDKKNLKNSEMLYSKIRVFNEKGEPQSGVNILVQNKEKKIVTGFQSDKNGRFPPLSFYDKYIQYFTISWISSREFSIPADSLFGYSTNIEVHLKNSTLTYHNSDAIIKFLITKQTKESLELQLLSETSNTLIRLQKIGEE